jgi:hypothetical protein
MIDVTKQASAYLCIIINNNSGFYLKIMDIMHIREQENGKDRE